MATTTTAAEITHHDTLITNPGIADRLEKDVGEFHQYGFSFKRCSDPPEHGILRAPVASSLRAESVTDGVHKDSDDAPPAQLTVVIALPSLIASIGPFLRTLVRISDGIDPRTLRVFICFEWRVHVDIDNESTDVSTAEARKIAHYLHMIVRNSMGAALFLTSLSILLPYDITVDRIREVMRQNEDVNYPTIILIERPFGKDDVNSTDEITLSKAKVGRRAPPVIVKEYLQNRSNAIHVCAKVFVETRMCTVRLTPVLYHLARALRGDVSMLRETDNDVIQPLHSKLFQLPLIFACVDKVANLLRIIMLARDYRSQHRLVIVVRDESIRSRMNAESIKFIAGLDPSDACGSGNPRVETIVDTVRLLRTEFDGNVLAIDLHDDAVTLDDDNKNATGQTSALPVLRSAKAVIWGFENDGVPPSIDRLATQYIQIRCRSSLNLVSSMSVVMHRAWSERIRKDDCLSSITH